MLWGVSPTGGGWGWVREREKMNIGERVVHAPPPKP